MQGSQLIKNGSLRTSVSQNAGIAAHKKWESQNNGTVSQNAGIAAYKKNGSLRTMVQFHKMQGLQFIKMGISEQWYSFTKCRDRRL
jgi:hypothetical protein